MDDSDDYITISSEEESQKAISVNFLQTDGAPAKGKPVRKYLIHF